MSLKKDPKEVSQFIQSFIFSIRGVFRVLRKQGFLDLSSEIEGAALEGLVAEHLRSWIFGQKEKHDLYFWRTRAGLEIDFIIYGEKTFYAIEVKNSQTINPHDIRGLKEFNQDYPSATLIMLYRGKEKMKRDNIFFLPAETFLQKLDPRLELKQILNF